MKPPFHEVAYAVARQNLDEEVTVKRSLLRREVSLTHTLTGHTLTVNGWASSVRYSAPSGEFKLTYRSPENALRYIRHWVELLGIKAASLKKLRRNRIFEVVKQHGFPADDFRWKISSDSNLADVLEGATYRGTRYDRLLHLPTELWIEWFDDSGDQRFKVSWSDGGQIPTEKWGD